MAKKTSFEDTWRAEEDANTLARYQEIISDKKRLSKAMSAAQTKMNDLKTKTQALSTSLARLKKK